ncbi:hypothetical protein CgunFtcFv8_001677 [Champsocephalus gunnari]|uniref:Uncharacterized protein n=1 Tax=Champsocephalus gunnari TaxID=52237 RepID=A0AAN8CLF7_CHAGU|nr:hypothetical protein CgunFtcFv8_001677 [Champsocephalus gunnari]
MRGILKVDMCFYENVRSHVLSGSGVDVGLWREGGSATALTGFQAPQQKPQTLLPPPPLSTHPCRGRCQIQHSIHETNTNSHCPPRRGSQRLRKTFGRRSLVYIATIIRWMYKERLRPTPEPLKTLLTTF